ncbi:MAG: hypothetical protein CM15mV24_0220 [Bellamyvirus sp.]|nr:MAG: hypothetical protein CM15mV24_0220 [Bellamyvirus sp.]
MVKLTSSCHGMMIPGNSGVAVEKIKIRGVTWTQSGERGKQKQSVELKGGSPASGLSGGTKVA